FYDRHWETVSYRLSADVAGEIAMVIDAVEPAASDPELSGQLRHASDMTELDFTFRSGGLLPEAGPASGTTLEKQLSRALTRRVQRPFRIDDVGCERCVLVDVQLDAGVLSVNIPRGRLFTATTYIFILWMVGSSLVLLAIATVFLRNQVKSLRRLAAAAESFGKGRPVSFYKAEGALEVRQAAAAFIRMRARIERQIRQRTEMLAGVSHDLRTPLTRMKLALELLGSDPAVAELKSDVAEMEHMVHGYLDFVRGEGTEASVETDISLLIEDLAADLRREGTPLTVTPPPEFVMPIRPNALRRCLGNLIGNARRHASHVWLTGI